MHCFIFQPGQWLGYGQLTFSHSPAVIQFYTKWLCSPIENDEILCEQYIEKQDVKDVIFNLYRITKITPNSFDIQLQSETMNRHGKGHINETSITWQFEKMTPEHTVGQEKYVLLPSGEYQIEAVYTLDADTSTMIKGRLWATK